MRAKREAADSQYAKIVRLVKKAQEEKAPIQRLADKYAILFTPLTLFMASLGFWLTGDPLTILSVLVVATPCPLILATPLAVICGINRAADLSIIVKGGAALEQIASAKAVLFDKTGTITFGTPFVESVTPVSGIAVKDVLYYAAIFEQMSTHSIAKAIVAKALETSQHFPLPQNFKEMPGQGVEGDMEGSHYLIGSRRFLEERSVHSEIPHVVRGISVFVVRDGEMMAVLDLTDHIRKGVPKMIQTLRGLGVEEIAMLTGDSRKNGELIAKQAGIERVEAELLPEQKAEIVREIEARCHPVVMVGDGINDAPALATATVGIAMGATGTAISAEAADIVILVDDPMKVVTSIQVGKRMLRVAKQSIWIGIGLSFSLMLVAISGHIVPAVGAMLQEIIDVAVILNALRAR
jgi:heavy metal translocating P-type ATPase